MHTFTAMGLGFTRARGMNFACDARDRFAKLLVAKQLRQAGDNLWYLATRPSPLRQYGPRKH